MGRAAVGAAVLLTVAAGCLPRAGDGASRSARPPAALAPADPGGLYVHTVLLERPAGDSLLDRDLWAGESSAFPARTRLILAANGLRAAVLGGHPPPALQKLFDSEADTVNSHGATFANRSETVVPTAEPPDPCGYAVVADLGADPVRVSLRQARAGVLVRPERTPDGRVKVYCEPRVQAGDRVDRLIPTADGTGFRLEGEVPVERYPALGFEVPLTADDYLVVGSPADATDTLGAALFGAEVGGRPRQRVLVIRAGWKTPAK